MVVVVVVAQDTGMCACQRVFDSVSPNVQR